MIQPGSLAPDFKLPLVGGGFATRDLLIEGGRPGLLVFFKTECPTCRLAFPILQRMYSRVQSDSKLSGFLAIAQNSAAELPEFFVKYGAAFPVAHESDPYPVANAYQITNVPTIFLLEEHGVILRTAVGFNRNEFDTLTKEMLSRAGAPAGASLFTSADAGLPALQPG
ncbi:MAG: peroxiredoxin family protein [Planctomycetota bacterium]